MWINPSGCAADHQASSCEPADMRGLCLHPRKLNRGRAPGAGGAGWAGPAGGARAAWGSGSPGPRSCSPRAGLLRSRRRKEYCAIAFALLNVALMHHKQAGTCATARQQGCHRGTVYHEHVIDSLAAGTWPDGGTLHRNQARTNTTARLPGPGERMRHEARACGLGGKAAHPQCSDSRPHTCLQMHGPLRYCCVFSR